VIVGVSLPSTTESAPPAARGGTPLVGLSLASQTAAIAPEQSGKIVSIPVRDGQRVVKDQVIAKLSSRLQEIEVERLRVLAKSNLIELRARAGLKHAEQGVKRAKELREHEISSDSDLQDKTFELELAQLMVDQAAFEQDQANRQYEEAKERLAQRTLRTPIDGIVAQRFKQQGETVEKYIPVLEVMTLHPLWVEFDCPVADEGLFRVGTELTVFPSVRPADTRVARVVYTAMRADPSSHTFVIRAAVPNEDYSWKAGLKMLVRRPAVGEKRPAGKPGK
jgi:RND family efflux transporter MFP subunit